MEQLKKLHKLLKEEQPLRDFISLVEKMSSLIASQTPEQFALSKQHELLCVELEKMNLKGVEEAFKELPPIPQITAIILKASKEFTLAFLMIPANRCFGWHDHTNMNGISKCISGELEIKSLNPVHLQECPQQNGVKNYLYPVERLREEKLNTKGQKISIIYPDSFNVHQIYAKCQSSFIDLLMPEYPDNSCHYFKSVQQPQTQMQSEQDSDSEEKIKLYRIEESYEKIFGLEALVKHFREEAKKKIPGLTK